MNQAKFESELANEYSAGFEALQNAIDLGDKFMQTTSGSETRGAADLISSALFLSMYHKLLSAQLLLRKGYGDEASIIARAFVESFIDLFYLINNSKEDVGSIAERYTEFAQHVVPYQYLKALEGLNSELLEGFEGMTSEAKKRFESFMQRYPKPTKSKKCDGDKSKDDKIEKRRNENWSGKNLRERAIAGRVEDSYTHTYMLLSASVHSAPDAISRLLSYDKNSSAFLVGSHERNIALVLKLLAERFPVAVEYLATFFSLPTLAESARSIHQKNLALLSILGNPTI